MSRHRPDGSEIWCVRHKISAHSRPAVHTYSVIVLHEEGRVWVDQDGRWEAAPGDVRLIPAGTPHSHLEAEGEVLRSGGDRIDEHAPEVPGRSRGRACESVRSTERPMVIGVGFCAACLRTEGLGELLAPLEAVRAGRSPLLRPPPPVVARLRGLLEGLQQECRQEGRGTHRARRAWLELVLIELGRLEQAAVVAASGGLVADALAWLEAHAFEPITPTDVARALRRSPAHLTTAVREQTGQTVGQWIVSLRMAEARRRLRETDERVDVIGERVGYPDPSHFSRVFRRTHGCSPTQWRRVSSSPPPPAPAPG
jgi:AraC family transcriptional activator of pobA